MSKENQTNTMAYRLLGDILDKLDADWMYTPGEKVFLRLRKLSKLMAIELLTPQIEDEEEIEEPFGDMDQFGGDEHGIISFIPTPKEGGSGE